MQTATLIVEISRDVDQIGKSATITHVPFTMGRSGNDMNFNDSGISRGHAEITYNNGVYFVVDKGSTNHTFVDGNQISSGTPSPLHNGTTIRMGSSTTVKLSLGS